jgi:trans-aconitate 2-methyltransferase
MHTEYPFDGTKYEKASQCQREWGTELIEELQLRGDEFILDLGCGSGVLTRALAERVTRGRVVGVDSSRSMLEAARAHKTANMELKLLDMNTMAFDAEFDVVFSNAALHWVLDHEKLLRIIYTALKPGGFLRAQFGAYGNVSNFSEGARDVMKLPAYAPYFKGFRWPWYMPTPEEYEKVLSHTEFRNYRVWSENKDRYFSEERTLISMVEEAGMVPFLAVLPEDVKQVFSKEVFKRLVAKTKQPDGRCFETFRRINVYAEK